MEISSRKFYNKIMIDTIDDWLKEEGYIRKTSPKDPTCLFRAISEQVYKTQYYHIKVRRECVDFMRKNKHLFEKNISISIDDYLEQLSCITEWGGHNELEAMSFLYKKEFLIYNSVKMTKKIVTNNGFKEFIYLCHTPPKHYESMYSQKTHAVAAFCQSVVYKLLYERVFQMPDVEHAVEKMLHEPSQNSSQNKFMLKDNFEVKEHSNGVNKLEEENRVVVHKTLTPFPYRVAKALDPNIYRNIDYDIWLEIKREVRNAGWLRWNNYELQVGGKCLVQLNSDDEEVLNENTKELENIDKNGNISIAINSSGLKKESVSLVGHIQEMSQNEGPVTVYIVELGKKKTVPYRALKPFQQEPRRNKSFIISSGPPKKNFFDQNSKWKKQTNSYARKPRNLVTNPSNIPILNSHVGLDALDNENNNNHVNNGNDSGDSVNVKQIVTSTTNNSRRYNSKEFNTTDLTITNGMDTKNYSSGQEHSLNNVIEAQSTLSSSDHNEPISNSNYSGEHFNAKSFTSKSQDNQVNLNEKNIKNNLINGNENLVTPDTTVPVVNDNYCSNSVGPVPAYPGNLNLIWLSPEGNIYAPFFYFGGNCSGPSIAGMLNCSNQPVNFGALVSVDSNGNDLPYSDIPTLRFFYNLGIEYFRCNQAWASNSPSVPCTPTFLTNEENIAPIGIPCHINSPAMTSSNESTFQQHDNNLQAQINLPTRKNERVFNNKMNTKVNANTKNIYPRKYSQDIHQDTNKNRNEGITGSYDYHKSKHSYRNNENRDMHYTQWESRKNKGAVQFKKANEDRHRIEKYNCHYEHQRKPNSFNNHYMNHNNNNNNNNINSPPTDNNYEDQKFVEKRKNYDPQVSSGQVNGHGPMQPPANSPVSSINHQLPFNHQSPPVFTGIPYYQNEVENMYSLPGNVYPVSFLSHSDSAEGNNIAPYCCPNLDNYPQPIYPPISFSPSSVMPSPPPPQPMQPLFPAMVPPNSPESWYIPGQAHFIPYPPHFPAPSSVPLPPQNNSSS